MDMHCIKLPVKFEDGLSISVLRNKQLFTKKNRGSHFQNADFGEWEVSIGQSDFIDEYDDTGR
jgi:hypothetical protein